MKKLIITIGITAYNEEKNIQNLLKSILAQKTKTFMVDKIIVVSDGSTDETVRIVKGFSDKRIVLIDGDKRFGQNARQNQIIRMLSRRSNGLLFIEADTLPATKTYIQELVNAVPKNKKFSIIVGMSVPVPSQTYFGKIIEFGTRMRYEIFEKAYETPNVFLYSENALFSRKFLRKFRWNEQFNEDSYAFRMAVRSKLPLFRVVRAKKYFKTVDNIQDYFLQSGKFQKAQKKENEISDVYSMQYSFFKGARIAARYCINRPDFAVLYLILFCLSRMYAFFLPEYTKFWSIYESSKNISIGESL